MSRQKEVQWPKSPPPISEKQKQLKADFLKMWHEILPKKYGLIEKFNHSSTHIKESIKRPHCKTLEIGSGLGEHLSWEDLSNQDYTALEIREDFNERAKQRFPGVNIVKGDIEKGTGLPSGGFDRIIAVHILEHLRDLPSGLKEIKRLLKTNGTFVAIIPTEGGLAYEFARTISAKRLFEKTFKVPYGPIIQNEHVNKSWEIMHELKKYFTVEESIYWPFKIPLLDINLVISLKCSLPT